MGSADCLALYGLLVFVAFEEDFVDLFYCLLVFCVFEGVVIFLSVARDFAKVVLILRVEAVPP